MQHETETTQRATYFLFLGSYADCLATFERIENWGVRYSLLEKVAFALGVDPAAMPPPDEMIRAASRLTPEERQQAMSNLLFLERDVREIHEDFETIVEYVSDGGRRLSGNLSFIVDALDAMLDDYDFLIETAYAVGYALAVVQPEKTLETWRDVKAIAKEVVAEQKEDDEEPSPIYDRWRELAAYAQQAMDALAKEQKADAQASDEPPDHDADEGIDLESLGEVLGHREGVTRHYLNGVNDCPQSTNESDAFEQ